MNSAKLTGKTIRCDGNHGGPRCADPECWNDFLDHVDHTGQPIDPVDALRLERESHQTTLQALGDVKRELAHYKAGEQPRVEDRDREIAELKQQMQAAPRAQTCETCRFLQRPSVDLPKVWWCGHVKSPLGTRHFTREKIVQLSCIFHVPAAPAPASTEEK